MEGTGRGGRPQAVAQHRRATVQTADGQLAVHRHAVGRAQQQHCLVLKLKHAGKYNTSDREPSDSNTYRDEWRRQRLTINQDGAHLSRLHARAVAHTPIIYHKSGPLQILAVFRLIMIYATANR